MITIVEIRDLNNNPVSRTATNNIKLTAPAKVIYKFFNYNDSKIGELVIHHIEKKVFVIMNVLICEISYRKGNILMKESKFCFEVNMKMYIEKTKVNVTIPKV